MSLVLFLVDALNAEGRKVHQNSNWFKKKTPTMCQIMKHILMIHNYCDYPDEHTDNHLYVAEPTKTPQKEWNQQNHDFRLKPKNQQN